MNAPLSAEEAIRRGNRIKEFLEDPIIRHALEELKEDNYVAFTNADSSDKRVTAWAKAQVLQDFAVALAATVDAGKRGAAELENAEKRKTRK